jgi:hypothetical protein
VFPDFELSGKSETIDTVGTSLDEITKHFEDAKAAAFESARGILGERFDPTKPALLADLEKNIERALERVSQPQSLASAARLHGLRILKPEQLDEAQAKIYRDELALRLPGKAIDILLLGGGRAPMETVTDKADVRFLSYADLLSDARYQLDWLIKALSN